MSLVVAAYGYGWAVLGADRGMWEVNDAGETINVSVHHDSKLKVVPDYPMVIATSGPVYSDDVVKAFIEREPIAKQQHTHNTAHALWRELSEHHAARYGANEYDYYRRGMSMLVASVDSIGFARTYIGDYPAPDPQWVSAYRWGGEIQWGTFGTGICAIGSNNFEWRSPLQKLNAERGIEVVKIMLDAVSRLENLRVASGEVTAILPPYDIVLLTRSGVEWVQGAPIGFGESAA